MEQPDLGELPAMTREQSEGVRQRRSSVQAGEPDELNDELDELHALLAGEHERWSFLERIGRQPGAALVLIVNLVPALLALWFDWDPFAIVLIYWFENGVIGLVNALKIAFAQPRLRTQADVLAGLHQAGIFKLPPVNREFLAKLQRRPAERIPAAKTFALPAFLLTFPVFMALHAVVLFRLFEGVGPSGLWPALRSSLSAGLGVALAALAIEHLWSFGYEFLYRDGRRHTIPILQVAQPFPKLIVIHVALLAGALIAQLLPAAAITAVALVLLKTALDMGLVLRIRINRTGLREMLEEDDDAEESGRSKGRSPRAAPLQSRQAGGSLVLALPRHGLRVTSRRFSGLLVTSLAFTIIGAVMLTMLGLVPIGAALSRGFGFFESIWSFVMPVFGVPFGGLLMAAGLTTLHSAIRAGWTRAEIRVSGGELEILERGVLTWRRATCAAAEVVSIGVIESGTSVNDVPFCLLEIRRRGGRTPFEVLYGRPEAELGDVAEQLRGALDALERPCEQAEQAAKSSAT